VVTIIKTAAIAALIFIEERLLLRTKIVDSQRQFRALAHTAMVQWEKSKLLRFDHLPAMCPGATRLLL
jgi:hypothetical protein